jgi:hypothetical protein
MYDFYKKAGGSMNVLKECERFLKDIKKVVLKLEGHE